MEEAETMTATARRARPMCGAIRLWVGVVLALALAHADMHGQQVHRNGFETRDPAWVKGGADAPFQETAHELTDVTAHTGQQSEHIRLTATPATFIHYFYATSPAPVSIELSASLWFKSNRPGAQLLARLVLPHERNPNSLDDRLTTIIRGDQYQNVGRWQRLELRRPVKLATEQQQLMRVDLKRDVDFTDAYVDRLILNVYGGPGQTDVWIDDLEIGPVTDNRPAQLTSRPVGASTPGTAATVPQPLNRAGVVELNQNRLLVSGKPFFMRGIRHSDTPLKALRDAGFNTVWFDYATSPALIEEAVNLGFWVVPSLPVTAGDDQLATPDAIRGALNRFALGDAVLFWDLGGGLVEEQKDLIAHAAQVVRASESQRPVGLDVWDGFQAYSRLGDAVGFHRWPLMTGMELPQYRDWLNQRRQLTRQGTFTWTWVQTHLPDWYTTLVYNRPASAGFTEPIGPQPEQIRLLTYIALASGCRGLGFWSDRFLADTHQGRDRLLALAMLNQELQLLEPLLVDAEAPVWINTSEERVKAAVLRNKYGVLVLPMWLGKGSQFVPAQSATARLQVTVPEVSAATQAWEISPGEVRSLQTERVVGGTRVTIPEFGLTAAILFTGDNGPTGILVRYQEQVRRMRKLAAQWAHDLAEVELDKITRVETQLEAAGHTLPDGTQLLDNARSRLRKCVEHWNNGDYRQAYQEADRSLRPLRILMRAQWEEATKRLDTPVNSAFALSFFTLPQQWALASQLKQLKPGPNVLRGGDFEAAAGQSAEGWSFQEARLDAVETSARRVEDQPEHGKQCLVLEMRPAKGTPHPRALERTFLAINSPVVHLQPGTLVQIGAWIRIPDEIVASADGALFYDSVGGEPLAVRLTGEIRKWRHFKLIRQVPESGAISVTLALTGLGRVFFDDVKIEPMIPQTDGVQAAGK
jgi:hypothetical protein